MHKAFAFWIVLVLLAVMSCVPAVSETTTVYSLDAAENFCSVWNDYYDRNGDPYFVGHILDDDNQTLRRFCIIYNGDNLEMDYTSGLIPPTANLFFLYDREDAEYGFCVFAEGMEANLEKAAIHGDGMDLPDIFVSSGHDSQDAWIMSIPETDLLDLCSLDEFTLELTVDGTVHPLTITARDYTYFYNMVSWLISAQLYCDPAFDAYMSADLLPVDARPTATPAPSTNPAYSFREDLDGVENAAHSVFYIEILDSNMDSIGRATGFVAFDEHLLVTNQHVIEDASYLRAESEDGCFYILNRVAISDKTHDIAVMVFPEGEKYTALPMNTDMELKRGQPVVTIGNPIGYRGTVAFGNISAFPVLADYGDLKCIQFTAPTSQGSSGGCLFNDYGELIGVTSAIGVSEYSGEVGNDVGLAVPIRVVRDLYDRWDKTSFETLGTRQSWDTVSYTPTPAPVPDPERDLSLETMHWTPTEGDQVILSFDVCNALGGVPVESFELSLYAADAAGNRVHGDSFEFSRAAEKAIGPGETVRSERFILSRWSRISAIYCRISKVRFSDGTAMTLDTRYDCYEVK